MDGDFVRRASGVGALADPVRLALYRYVVAADGPVGRDQAAAALELPRHVARFHLDRLVEAGLLVADYRRLTGRSGPGAGRPAKVYRRSDAEVAAINFNSPYKAANIRDFWDRWHITLSRWLRDYLYIPLGGNRKGKARAHANLFMTFVLAGLWHGAAWTFIVWGITHGMLLSLHRFWRDAGFSMPRALAWPLFLIWLNATMVIFRAESLTDSWHILGSLFGFNGFSSNINPVTTSETYRYIAVFGTIALTCPNTMQMLRWVPYTGHLAFKPTVLTTIAASGIALVALFFLLTTTGSEFLYFNF